MTYDEERLERCRDRAAVMVATAMGLRLLPTLTQQDVPYAPLLQNTPSFQHALPGRELVARLVESLAQEFFKTGAGPKDDLKSLLAEALIALAAANCAEDRDLCERLRAALALKAEPR